jgi:16S rRNA (guanine(966)-N(2))-methyltransferase RsmD
VRPTSDRLRETLFNVIAPRLEGARFLDLCAGSGAVGIEALSRGARQVTFVDRSRKMCSLIRANLELCRIENDESEVVQSEAHDYLRRAVAQVALNKGPWDIVFFDPPYDADYLPILKTFGADTSCLLTSGALLIVEHHHKNGLIDEAGSMIRRRMLKQGESALSFYQASE